MVARKTVCLRHAAGGKRSQIVRYGRFLNSGKVTVGSLIKGWGAQTAVAATGRHVLALHDTSEINFRTSAGRRRGLGEIAKGNSYGVLLHAMLAVDADGGTLLGLVAGQVWTRHGTPRRRGAPERFRLTRLATFPGGETANLDES